ncbi:MAG: NAD(P)/FAD-dependent oxidoreductase [Gemmatimonadota bacterium]|nr:NAD(P)/FAD-dependent oxidoreductase [Gemmatimonadota bacterium]
MPLVNTPTPLSHTVPDPTPSDTYDVAIVGGGPAGLSAAIWLGRYLHRVVLIDAGDPRNWETRGVHGYLGLEGITPAELRRRGREDARKFGATLIDATVNTVTRVDDVHFHLALDSGATIEASRLLLAIGVRDVWPDVPGLDKCYGATAHVCPDCDGYEARGKKTVVIGSGRKAVGLALALTTWTSEIVVCTNGVAPGMNAELLGKLDALNIPILETRIACVTSSGCEARSLELQGGMCLDCDQIFFAIGQEPSDDLGAQLGCNRDEIGRVITDLHFHTSVRNVYAAGDIIHGPQMAIAAAGTGTVAAVAIHHSMLPEGRKL